MLTTTQQDKTYASLGVILLIFFIILLYIYIYLYLYLFRLNYVKRSISYPISYPHESMISPCSADISFVALGNSTFFLMSVLETIATSKPLAVTMGSFPFLKARAQGGGIFRDFTMFIATRWGPPVISWFISPSNYSYKYHKP